MNVYNNFFVGKTKKAETDSPNATLFYKSLASFGLRFCYECLDKTN
jgi:hypothetical protein